MDGSRRMIEGVGVSRSKGREKRNYDRAVRRFQLPAKVPDLHRVLGYVAHDAEIPLVRVDEDVHTVPL